MELSEVNNLPSEILTYIFSFLSKKEVEKCNLVCKYWYECACDGTLWKSLSEQKDLTNEKKLIPPKDFSASLSDWKYLYHCFENLNRVDDIDMILNSGFDSSSFDEENQKIDATLTNNKKFWSSKGSADPDSSEFLIYTLKQPICIITSIDILPYKAHFQLGSPVYAPRSIQIETGFHPTEDYHYTSKQFPVQNIPEIQNFSLSPFLVVGGFVKLNLIGRYSTQPTDGLYYTVLKYVRIWGIPIGQVKPRILSESILNYSIGFNTLVNTLLDTNELREYKGQSPESLKDNEEFTTKVSGLFLSLDQKSFNSIRNELLSQMKELIREKRIKELIEFIRKQPDQYYLRGSELIEMFQEFLDCDTLVLYLKENFMINEDFKLTEEETVYFAKKASMNDIHSRLTTAFGFLLSRNRVTASREVGLILKPKFPYLASHIFLLGSCYDELYLISIETKDVDRLLTLCSFGSFYEIDLNDLFSRIKSHWKEREVLEFALSLIGLGTMQNSWRTIQEALGLVMEDDWDLRNVIRKRMESLTQDE